MVSPQVEIHGSITQCDVFPSPGVKKPRKKSNAARNGSDAAAGTPTILQDQPDIGPMVCCLLLLGFDFQSQ
jgi:hypothetical protein